MGCDNTSDFRLVDSMNQCIFAKCRVQRDQRNALLHTTKSRDQPLGSCFGEKDNILFRPQTQFSKAASETFGLAIHLGEGSPLVIPQDKLYDKILD